MSVVYEPVWAISAQDGKEANPDQANQGKEFIIQVLQELGLEQENIKILYGGSVDSSNAQDYLDIGFDGLLIGAASLDASEFVKVVKSLQK